MMEGLPLTDYLVMEVLAARLRLGEHCWPFPNALRPSLRRLEAKGLLSWKPGIAEGTCRAWTTLDGEAMFLAPEYRVPNRTTGGGDG